MSKPKTQYGKEIEAAWYTVSKFISPWDYVVQYRNEMCNSCIVTANPNCVVAANASKINLFKPSAISKAMFQAHFNRGQILYYKCARNAKLTTGYGRYDTDALNLPFAAELGVETKKKTHGSYCVLLIGIDIDCHNNEKHVSEVECLIQAYLPNTYWEASTGGKGRHGYIKIQYTNSFGVVEAISKTLKRLFGKLDDLRKLYGFEAKIDEPAGLPYKMELVDHNPYEANWSTLYVTTGKEDKFLGGYVNREAALWKDYVAYLKACNMHYITAECEGQPRQLNTVLSPKDIKTTFAQFLCSNGIVFAPPSKNGKYFKITYQRAFKLPMFGATVSAYKDATPRMDCIQQLHHLPYYSSAELQVAYKRIVKQIEAVNSTTDYDNSKLLPILDVSNCTVIAKADCGDVSVTSEVDPYAIAIPVKEGYVKPSMLLSDMIMTECKPAHFNTVECPSKGKEGEGICNNCACTNAQSGGKGMSVDTDAMANEVKFAQSVDWAAVSDGKKELDISEFWSNYKKETGGKKWVDYEEVVANLKYETDTMRKTALFIPAYMKKLGRAPTVEEAEQEYVSRCLNSNSAASTVNRQNRLRGCIEFYKATYDVTKVGCTVKWAEDKVKVLEAIECYLPDKVGYKQGKNLKSIDMDELGFVYYIIKRMGEAEQNCILANSLTYGRADECFLNEYGKKCGRHKFSGIIKVLLKSGLIEKVGSYKVGLRGNCYRVTVI
ncbi:MAG: hypothetical protein IH624_14355 [Phycisphaerae bacterium]|nr:hypothetical protein [Phycisphaerae bacterium]